MRFRASGHADHRLGPSTADTSSVDNEYEAVRQKVDGHIAADCEVAKNIQELQERTNQFVIKLVTQHLESE